MKIFYDFYEIAFDKGKSIGIYNYALSLLNALSLNYKDVDFFVSCSEEYKNDLPTASNIHLVVVSDKYPTLKKRIWWRYHKAIKTAKSVDADIYFSPKGFSPGILKRQSKPFIVVTIHDMIPFYYLEQHPGYFGFFQNHIITKTLLQSINFANSIITVSDFSKQMILKYCKKQTAINVVYNGVSVLQTPKNPDIATPYIFAITSNLPHKNKTNLINGYLSYASKIKNPLPLKICGINKRDAGIDLAKNTNITFIKYAAPDDFKELFANATVFLFVPEIEGFGFPPLEALMYDVPSVVADIPVLHEVMKNSAVFADPHNSQSIGNGLQLLLSNSILYENITNSKDALISQYNWDKCSDQTMAIFTELIAANR